MEVTLYQPDGPCHKCRLTKHGFDAHGIAYSAVTADTDTIDRFRDEGHSSFPVVVVSMGDSVTWTWSDYRRDNISELASLI